MLAEAWQKIESELQSGEAVLSSFAPDLNDRFDYADGLIVLTNHRLLSVQANGSPLDGVATPVRSWPLGEVATLRARDRSGLGVLEADGTAGGMLADWRYTAARTTEAHKLVERFAAFRRGEGASDDEEADRPAAESHKPRRAGASTLALFRLLRFTKARKGLVLLGFVLTLATTGAGLVPPYLTMPLISNFLQPFQNHRDDIDTRYQARLDEIDRTGPADAAAERAEARGQHDRALVQLQDEQRDHFMQIGWYLAAFGAAAVLTWALGWAQGVTMSYVSERISADLRNETYAHLNRLSLDFFGGRRTGDLIARLSTDTERLCSWSVGQPGRFRHRRLDDRGHDGLAVDHGPGVGRWPRSVPFR